MRQSMPSRQAVVRNQAAAPAATDAGNQPEVCGLLPWPHDAKCQPQCPEGAARHRLHAPFCDEVLAMFPRYATGCG